MNQMITVEEWMSGRLGTEIIELPRLSVSDQLGNYDKAGTGVGFVLVLAMMSTDEGERPEATQVDLQSLPVFKIRNAWMTPSDENFADVLSGIIRMVTPPAA